MAINVEILEYVGYGKQPGMRAPAPQGPENDITNVAAAAATALAAGTTVVTARNRAGGDSVYARFQATAGRANAAAGNSLLLAAGESYTWHLPKGANATAYEVDIRAIA